MMIRGRVVFLSSLVISLLTVRIASADSAPIWESPVGLVPGNPATRVQMRSEQVDIRVEERNGAAFAVVAAQFDLMNPAETESLKVGFPNWTYAVLGDVQGYETPYSPVAFSPDTLSHFRAWTDAMEYAPTVQLLRINPDDTYGSEWYVWDMIVPGAGPTVLKVAYEQRLSWDIEEIAPFVQPMYVLRTGALWDGPIGAVTVTMWTTEAGVFLGGPERFAQQNDAGEIETLPSAGSYLGLNQASEASPTRAVWRLTNVEPTQDVGTTYLFGGIWQTLTDGERRIGDGSASAETYVQTVQAATRLIGRWGPNEVPVAVLERFPASKVREWARESARRAPENPAAWEVLGDMELWFAFPPREHQAWLECWPTLSVEAYERASALGSAAARERRADLDLLREDQVLNGLPDPPPCP